MQSAGIYSTVGWPSGTIVLGKFNFPGTCPQDLPFKKDDVLKILHQYKEPSWYKARRENDGCEGLVPFNYLIERPVPELPTHTANITPPTTARKQISTSPARVSKVTDLKHARTQLGSTSPARLSKVTDLKQKQGSSSPARVSKVMDLKQTQGSSSPATVYEVMDLKQTQGSSSPARVSKVIDIQQTQGSSSPATVYEVIDIQQTQGSSSPATVYEVIDIQQMQGSSSPARVSKVTDVKQTQGSSSPATVYAVMDLKQTQGSSSPAKVSKVMKQTSPTKVAADQVIVEPMYSTVVSPVEGAGPSSSQPMVAAADTDTSGVKGEVKLQKMPWFHGKISREEVDKLLIPHSKDGIFLVRESIVYKGDYTLCVSCEGKVNHYRVHQNDEDMVTVDGIDYFENLFKLIEHYKEDDDGLCCKLEHSIEKKENVEVFVDQVEFIKQGWAIPRAKMKMMSVIGKGEFGEVWLAEYKDMRVAIKMLKDIQSKKDTQQFLVEASVMTTLQHPNLVKLIGVSLDEPPICLVTEYMSKGSLQSYLRSRGRSVLRSHHLLEFAKHVCQGMEYLESKNFIHRDLAARNVLVSSEDIAKVSDFGLALEGVSRASGQKLPVKWTAPEALRDSSKFSNKSDVWSFGILLWEVYSYGRIPYPKVLADDLLQKVESGYRMDSPDGCPEDIYAIMRSCWDVDPNTRPLFKEILVELNREVSAL